ncbi:MAG: hypothetical protein Q8K55_02905, partial [Gemmatimonadaceae bacterium]|nr:hypothetical protein [Gemmatimonadaceae bacterium]
MNLLSRTRLPIPRHAARLSARLAVRAAAFVLLGVGAGCGKDSTPPLVATTLTASVSSLSFDAVGATASFAVTVRDQNGTAMPSAAPTVTSSA